MRKGLPEVLERWMRPVHALVLTAYARGSDRDRAIATGFDAHLAKPVSPATLVATVRAVLASGNGG